jgi:hypothetical protein
MSSVIKKQLLFIFTLIVLVLSYKASGQSSNADVYIHGVRGKTSNLLYCYGYSRDRNPNATVDYFTIERYEIDDLDSSQLYNRKTFILQAVQTESDLQKVLSDREIIQMMAEVNVRSTEELVQFIKRNKEPKAYGVSYLSPKVKKALGHLFEDENIDLGKSYVYKVKARMLGGRDVEWGVATIKPEFTNYTLEFLKPRHLGSFVYDSTVVSRWYLDVSPARISKIIRPSATSIYHQRQMDFMQFSIANSMVQVNHLTEGGSIAKETLLGYLNYNKDSLIYTSLHDAKPGQMLASFVRVVDEFGNPGLHSDTSVIFTISEANMPILSKIYADEIEDGIVVSWSDVPFVPYISGIELVRINSSNKVDTMGVFPKTATSFTDRNIKIGETYTYLAKLLYAQGVNLEQKIPAMAVGQYSSMSKPNIPEELRAELEDDNVRLTWNSVSNVNVFGYYVYRGTNYFERELLAGPLRDTFYVDNSFGLSGGTTYFYSVVAQNLMQDTSLHSTIAEITPNRPIHIQAPLTAEFYLSNDGLVISWQDIAKVDDLVGGYKVYKKKEGEKEFKLVAGFVDNPLWIDSAVRIGEKVEYRISSISYRGDEGRLSHSFYYDSKKVYTDKMNTFRLANTTDGVRITIPTIIIGSRMKYIVYREDKDGTTKKLGEIPSGNFEFVDKTARSGQRYWYSIAIEFENGQVGTIGSRKSMVR